MSFNKRTIILGLGFLLVLTALEVQAEEKNNELHVLLNDSSQLTIEGDYRFVEIAGITGLHVTSLKTKAFIETNVLNAEKGSISFWMSPLESMSRSYPAGAAPETMKYPFLSDWYPPQEADSSNFSVYYQSVAYPSVISRFTSDCFGQQLDYGLGPFVYAEDLPLVKGQWYRFVVTWDKLSQNLEIFINGQMTGHNYSAGNFMEANSRLYIGNPLMVISHLKIQNKILTREQVKGEYQNLRPAGNDEVDEIIQRIYTVQESPESGLTPGSSREKIYECKFNQPADIDECKFQTGDLFYDKFKLEVTDDKLYWETPDIVHVESRGYLWCPVNVEGDQFIEFEFQLVSSDGLALLILCASGLHGEDIIHDHGLKKTGSMGDMLSYYRNYHWEYVRRVEAMRTDVETQYVNKNPWAKNLYSGCIPRLEQNKWYKLSIAKKGHRLVGAIDGKVVFDVEDDPFANNGPVFNSGRVVLRQTYHTAMKYRIFVIYKMN